MQSIAKLNLELNKKLNEEKEATKSKANSKAKSKAKVHQRGKSVKVIPAKPSTTLKELQLNKEEELVKDKLIKGGQFDAVG